MGVRYIIITGVASRHTCASCWPHWSPLINHSKTFLHGCWWVYLSGADQRHLIFNKEHSYIRLPNILSFLSSSVFKGNESKEPCLIPWVVLLRLHTNNLNPKCTGRHGDLTVQLVCTTSLPPTHEAVKQPIKNKTFSFSRDETLVYIKH